MCQSLRGLKALPPWGKQFVCNENGQERSAWRGSWVFSLCRCIERDVLYLLSKIGSSNDTAKIPRLCRPLAAQTAELKPSYPSTAVCSQSVG